MRISRLIKVLLSAFLISIALSGVYSAYGEGEKAAKEKKDKNGIKEETYLFRIEQKSRHDALIELALQIKHDLVFGTDVSTDLSAREIIDGLNGLYSIKSALDILLYSSDLFYEQDGLRILIYKSENKAVKLPPITVVGYLQNANSHISHEDLSLDRFPLHQIPLSVQSLSQKFMSDVQSRNIDDALEYVSGIEYYSNNGGIDQQYYSRGIKTPYGIDGKFYRRTTLTLDSSVLERLDLAAGPSASFLSPGGLINFVTKKPEGKPHQEISLTSGSYDFYRTELDVNVVRKNNVNKYFRFIGVIKKENHIKELAYNNKFVIAPSLTLEFDNNSQLLVSAYHKTQKLYPNTFTFHDDLGDRIPRKRTLGAPWEKASIRDSFIAIDFSDFNVGNWKASAGINWNHSKIKNDFALVIGPASPINSGYKVGDFIFIQISPQGPDLRAYGNETSNAFGLDFSAEKKSSLFNISNLTRIGADYRHHTQYTPDYEPFRFFGIFNIYEPNYTDLEEPPPQKKRGSYQQNNHFAGISISQSTFFPKGITLHTDFRYENIKSDTLLETVINLGEEPRNIRRKSKGDYRELTPQAGLNVRISDTTSLHFSYRESFSFQNSPNAQNIMDLDNYSTDIVAPIKNRQRELSVKKEWLNGELFGNVTFYKLIRSNIITFEENQNNNQEDQFSKGIDINLNGAITPDIDLLVNFSYNENTTLHLSSEAEGATLGVSLPSELNAGNQALGTAKRLANAWINYHPRNGPLKNYSLGIGIKYVDERNGDGLNQVTLPSYVKYDLFASYHGRNSLTLSFSVRNATNKYYYESSLGLPQLVEEGNPRSYYLTLKTRTEF